MGGSRSYARISNDADRAAVMGYLDNELRRTSCLVESVVGSSARCQDDRKRLRAEIDRLLQCRRDLCSTDVHDTPEKPAIFR
jgi:hypothetical protein